MSIAHTADNSSLPSIATGHGNQPWFTDKRGIAARYHVSERTTDNWIRQRRIAYVKCGRVVRFNIGRCDTALSRLERKEVAR